MFSNNGGIHIPVSGGTPWVRVPMNSNYPSQRIEIDGNMYAPVSEVHKPRTSVPIISNTNTSVVQDSRAYTPTSLYVDGLYNSTPESRMNYYIRVEQQAKEEAKRQQESLITANINKQLNKAASEQYSLMDKLYIQGGLDAMRKEYYRVSAGTEGYNSVYARAAYNALCIKDKEESLNTPTITKVANESYEQGGINSLTSLVKYYENNGYPVYANIAKRILKQKEEQEEANNLLTATLAKINKQLPLEDKELLCYPPEIIGNPDAIYKYLAEIEPLTKTLEDIKQGNFSNNKLAGSYWTEKEALLKKLSHEVGYTDFEKLIENYINWKGNANLNEPAYSDENNIYQQLNTRQMAIDIGLKNFKPTQNDTKKINEKYSHYQTVVSKVIEANNLKVNKLRDIADIADDILHKKNYNNFFAKLTIDRQDIFEGSKPPTKEEKPDWWQMAKKAFNGDRSPEVLEWQQNNRDKMRYIASVFDGVHEGSEIFNEPLRKYKAEIRENIKEGEQNLDNALQDGDLNPTQELLHRIKKVAYEVTDKIADTFIPDSMIDVGLMVGTLGVGTATTKIVTKEAGKLLFSYKMYRHAEKQFETQAKNIMKNGPTDRIQHEAFKTQLRQNMKNPSPAIKNIELLDKINNLYRPAAKLGNKCTSDAVRYELHTFKKVEGSFHIQKCQQTINSLEKWIKNNPTADPGDRAIAENILLELKDALGEKPWYSQTKPPKH